MNRSVKQLLATRVSLVGGAFATGFALGAYLSGESGWIPLGAVLAIITAMSGFLIAQYTARSKPNWDPLSPFAGARIVFLMTALFAGGLSGGGGTGQLAVFLNPQRPFPSSSLIPVGLAGLLFCNGLWWLSWSGDDLHYGKYRWFGWFHLGVGGVVALLLLALK